MTIEISIISFNEVLSLVNNNVRFNVQDMEILLDKITSMTMKIPYMRRETLVK